MEKTRRRGWRKQLFGLSAIIFAASFIVSLVPSIWAIAEGAIFKIKSAEITQLSSGVDGVISSHDDSTIVSDVTFHKLGDTVTYKVVLQNTDSKDHVIETISDDNANSRISYSYDKHANETIAAGANLDFVFEAKYAKTPNTNERQQVSKVKFSIRSRRELCRARNLESRPHRLRRYLYQEPQESRQGPHCRARRSARDGGYYWRQGCHGRS